MKVSRTIPTIALCLALLPAPAAIDTQSGRAADPLVELANHLGIRLGTCIFEELEEVQAAGYSMVCATTDVPFREFRKRWNRARKQVAGIEPSGSTYWDDIPNGGKKDSFWFHDLAAYILYNDGDIRIVTVRGMTDCETEPLEQPSPEAETAPVLIHNTIDYFLAFPTRHWPGQKLRLRTSVDDDGTTAALCTHSPSEFARTTVFKTVQLVNRLQFKPAARDGSPVPAVVDLEILIPHRDINPPREEEQPPAWVLLSISPAKEVQG